ncbi:dephospho-CoA kinase [Flavobacterium salilacus subsp. salilacus]|uniref:dephospho-CoA kinase n=1 Tax=Flavobacterium TaxID=237 RepID=UPI001074D885|nr:MULTISPECIES: dephospho-CoA kinase [Flavobacterium]KAF2517502.1 dephospho-CoA kinase [Flavobacterium salilacus subsp. salilacus]MBE1615650.1 dephospho-CoA kinase [Flavobacterium sp. SaA2.13]
MKTKVIGLTGGIGSGKTTIANYFASLGVPVYIADEEAKNILYTPDVIAEVTAAFGEGVLTEGIPDRKKLAAMVFNSPEKLQTLNTIIHPKVNDHFYNWLNAHKNVPFVIKEAAILFESGSYKNCDKIILVTAPKDIRVQRVMKRDGSTEEEVQKRMDNQWSDEKKRELSDFIINNIVLEDAKNQVYSIYNTLKNT